MFNLKEIFEKGRIKYLTKKENKEKIIEYFLKCKNIKEALKYLDNKYLLDLDLSIYEMPVEGYMNVYDYIINERNINIQLPASYFESRNIYIPYILKFKSLSFMGSQITNDMLLDKLPNGQTILEYVIENDPYINLQTSFPVTSKEVAEILYKNNLISQLQEAIPEILLTEIDGDKTVLDVLKEENILPRLKYIKESKEKFSYNFNLTPKRNHILDKIDDKTLLQILIEKGFDFNIELNEIGDEEEEWKEIIKILINNDALDKLKNAPEAFLTTQLIDEEPIVRIIDVIQGKNLPSLDGRINDPEIIKSYIFEDRCDDILLGITKDALVIEYENGITVLDLLICHVYKNKGSIAELLTTLDRRNLLTPEASLILAKYGLYIKTEYKKTIGINSDADMYSFIYKEDEVELDKEANKYITKFINIMDDGKSDKALIDLAIKSFKRTYQMDKTLAIRDITALIEFKKQHEEFKLEYNQSAGSSFTAFKDYAVFKINPVMQLKNKYNIDTFNHELGHLIHSFLGPEILPKEIRDELEGTDEINIRVYREKFNELNQEATEQLLTDEEYEKMFYEFIKEKYKNEENYIQIIKGEFERLIGTKELVLEAINDGSYSQDVLIALVNAYYEDMDSNISKEELLNLYVENRIKSEKKMFKEELYRKTNVEFLCYENFIDAYYQGGIYEYTRTLSQEERKEIKAPLCTHDRMYFIMQDGNQFNELYANYMELKKSPKGAYYIEKLKEKTSHKLIELIEQYDKALGENTYDKKTGKSR